MALKMERMVVKAIRRLQDVQGSTSREICNYISKEYNVPGREINRSVQMVLKRALSYGILEKAKGGGYRYNRELLEGPPDNDERVVDCFWYSRRRGKSSGRKRRRSRRGRKRSRRGRRRVSSRRSRRRRTRGRRRGKRRRVGRRRDDVMEAPAVEPQRSRSNSKTSVSSTSGSMEPPVNEAEERRVVEESVQEPPPPNLLFESYIN